MIEISYKKFGLIPVYEYRFDFCRKKFKWFSIVEISDVDKNVHIKGFKKEIHHTGITYLDEDLNQVFQSFSKTTRNEIRRAEKEGIKYDIIEQPTINDLKRYYIFYNKFLKSKKLPTIIFENIKKFEKYIILTLAKKDNNILCYHSYLKDYDLGKARLLHSCSHFRIKQNSENVEGGGMRNLIGYANKGLHFFDMKYFKKMGYHEYDWGGIHDGEDDISKFKISEFKRTFHPYEVNLYNYEKMPIVLKLLYNIKLWLGKIF